MESFSPPGHFSGKQVWLKHGCPPKALGEKPSEKTLPAQDGGHQIQPFHFLPSLQLLLDGKEVSHETHLLRPLGASNRHTQDV